MATIRFSIFIFVAHFIQKFAQIGVALIQKVGIANGNPIEFRVRGKETLQFGLSVFVRLQLLVEWCPWIDIAIQMQAAEKSP